MAICLNSCGILSVAVLLSGDPCPPSSLEMPYCSGRFTLPPCGARTDCVVGIKGEVWLTSISNFCYVENFTGLTNNDLKQRSKTYIIHTFDQCGVLLWPVCIDTCYMWLYRAVFCREHFFNLKWAGILLSHLAAPSPSRACCQRASSNNQFVRSGSSAYTSLPVVITSRFKSGGSASHVSWTFRRNAIPGA